MFSMHIMTMNDMHQPSYTYAAVHSPKRGTGQLSCVVVSLCCCVAVLLCGCVAVLLNCCCVFLILLDPRSSGHAARVVDQGTEQGKPRTLG